MRHADCNRRESAKSVSPQLCSWLLSDTFLRGRNPTFQLGLGPVDSLLRAEKRNLQEKVSIKITKCFTSSIFPFFAVIFVHIFLLVWKIKEARIWTETLAWKSVLFCAASFLTLTFRNCAKPREIQSCPHMSKRTIYLLILFSFSYFHMQLIIERTVSWDFSLMISSSNNPPVPQLDTIKPFRILLEFV